MNRGFTIPLKRRISARRCRAALMLLALVMTPLLTRPAQALGENYVARPFRDYYWQHQGMRVLGPSQTGLLMVDGYAAQYFEKGRLEDHRGETADPIWAFGYGRLTAELMARAPFSAVNNTSLTYAELAAVSEQRDPAPPGFAGGTMPVEGGVFVPFDPRLRPAAGYIVPAPFWHYITRPDLFPAGWLHDVGLPLTNALVAETVKQGQPRVILLQAFERTVLTYDPQNPPAWQVERGNIGSDALRAQGRLPGPTSGPHQIVVDLSEQWLYAYEGAELIFDAPVSTGRDGFETPPGHFAIYAKLELQTMRGARNGETWVVPDVPHVMYIYGDIALHGTYWHNRFGTGERLSHGCINLPLDAAALLYDWAAIGTPVQVRR